MHYLGKCTFGEAVLPAFAVPCTAAINEVKWASEKSAILHFRTPLPEKLSKQALAHIQAANGEHPSPMSIPVEELESYVAIDDPAKPQDESVAESPYDKAEIFWPIDGLPRVRNLRLTSFLGKFQLKKYYFTKLVQG